VQVLARCKAGAAVKTRRMWLAFAAISRVASADLAGDVEKTRGLRFKHPVEIVAQDNAVGSATIDAWGVAHGGDPVDAYYDGSAVIARPDAPELAIAAALDRALIEQRFPHAGSNDARRAYEQLETADAEVLAIDLSLVRAGKPPIWTDADAVGELVGAADNPAFTRIATARRTSCSSLYAVSIRMGIGRSARIIFAASIPSSPGIFTSSTALAPAV